ncbi:hypothetical protein [Pseudomonas sp. 8O]|uniref:hypothetical protein n=1 Tax=Pseudomonas sp. 8O TaxID=2653165 RepID=UPI0012F44B36|nr:hypothetical protein [Pseudomonas sp. 8O]VXB16920.1 conserved hypothetical protein [Pseudomonas sp. 8O]
MFLTMEHAEIPAGVLVKGTHMWRYVECLTSRAWFYVAVLEHHEDFTRPTIYMIKDLEDLLELAGAADQGCEIDRVDLVSPGDLNGSEGWKMDELKEIFRIHAGDQSSLAYLLRSGVIYLQDQRVKHQVETGREVIFALG